MSYTIHYVGPEAERRSQAMRDCRAWLGDHYDGVLEICAEHCHTHGEAVAALAFCGIQGFPARVLADHIMSVREANNTEATHV